MNTIISSIHSRRRIAVSVKPSSLARDASRVSPGRFLSLTLLLAFTVLALGACSLPEAIRSARSAGSDGRPKATEVDVPAGGSLAVGAFNYDTLNDQARFLAGMPGGRQSELRSLRETVEWEYHRRSMDQLWNYFVNSRYGRVQAWRDSEMPDLTSPDLVFYPFSGPDFLYADAFFPGARQYVMCGLEGADSLPDPRSISAGELALGLRGISGSLDTVLGASYFITKEMNVDLKATRFRGTLPLLMVFMARTDHSIVSVRNVDLTPAGELAGREYGGGAAPGLHIVCRSPEGSRKDVFYFREDLSNGTLASDRRLLSFVNRRGAPVTFVKSASYLMHDSNFSMIRDQVLSRSFAVLQDPSGVPYRYFQERNWDLTLYGNYVTTLEIFKNNFQSDMASAYRSGAPHPVKPMDFGVGYQHGVSTTSLILARSRSVAARTQVVPRPMVAVTAAP